MLEARKLLTERDLRVSFATGSGRAAFEINCRCSPNCFTSRISFSELLYFMFFAFDKLPTNQSYLQKETVCTSRRCDHKFVWPVTEASGQMCHYLQKHLFDPIMRFHTVSPFPSPTSIHHAQAFLTKLWRFTAWYSREKEADKTDGVGLGYKTMKANPWN